MDISFIMQVTCLNFYKYLKHIAVEGTVSQTFDIGPGLFSIKSRKNIPKNRYKVTRFLSQNKEL